MVLVGARVLHTVVTPVATNTFSQTDGAAAKDRAGGGRTDRQPAPAAKRFRLVPGPGQNIRVFLRAARGGGEANIGGAAAQTQERIQAAFDGAGDNGTGRTI